MLIVSTHICAGSLTGPEALEEAAAALDEAEPDPDPAPLVDELAPGPAPELEPMPAPEVLALPVCVPLVGPDPLPEGPPCAAFAPLPPAPPCPISLMPENVRHAVADDHRPSVKRASTEETRVDKDIK